MELRPGEPGLDQSDGVDGFRSYCDVRANVLRFQTFVAGRSGPLNGVSFTSFQGAGSDRFGDRPDAGLRVEVFQASNAFQPVGPALSGTVVTPDAIGWSPRNITVHPNIPVTAGTRYGIRVSSDATTGCYGLAYSDAAPYPGGGESYSSDSGATFRVEPNRSLKFHTIVGTGGSAAVTAGSSFESCCGWSLNAVNDGLTTSTPASMGWSSDGNVHADRSEWVQLDLGRSRWVGQVMVFPRSDAGNVGEGFPADFRVELSGDGTAWSTVLTGSDTPNRRDGKTFWFTAQPAQYVRLTGTSLRANPNDYGQYRMQLAELSVA